MDLTEPMDAYAQMRPSSKPTWENPSDFIENTKMSNFGLDDGGSPSGTVPIRRVSDDDRVQAQLLSTVYASAVHSLSTGPKFSTHISVYINEHRTQLECLQQEGTQPDGLNNC